MNTKIKSLLPTFNPALTPALTDSLANQIEAALVAGTTPAAISAMISAAGTTPVADANRVAQAICDAHKKAIANEKKAHLARPAALFAAVMATIAVIILGFMLIDQPWQQDLSSLATAQNVTDATKDLATAQQIEDLAKAEKIRFDTVDTAIADLAGNVNTGFSNMNDRLNKTDQAIADLAGDVSKTKDIVTTGLTYKSRCKKDSTEPACVTCFDAGNKRCYYRRPFQAASAHSVSKFRKGQEAKKVVTPTKSTTDKIEKKIEKKSTPKSKCPKGCVPGCPCPAGTTSGTTRHQLVPVVQRQTNLS